MKFRHQFLTLGLGAAAALLAASLPAKAALSFSDGDIFVGFRVSGAAQDSLLFNLGSYTQFTSAAPSSTLTFGGPLTLGADLASLYSIGGGSPIAWNDRTDLSWSIFGADSANGITLFASRSRTNLGVQATAWPSLSAANRGVTETAINTVRNGFIGTGFTTTQAANTPNAGTQVGTAVNSYYAAVNPANDFGRWNTIEGTNASGIDNTVLDLFLVRGTGNPDPHGIRPGAFTIGSDGTLTFTAAVPEPSISLLFAVGAAGLAFRRRRPQPAHS